MRDLILEYLQRIQPFLANDKLQQVADALNGDHVNQNCSMSKILSSNIDTIPTILIDPINGQDIIDYHDNINKPFKTIQYGLDYIR